VLGGWCGGGGGRGWLKRALGYAVAQREEERGLVGERGREGIWAEGGTGFGPRAGWGVVVGQDGLWRRVGGMCGGGGWSKMRPPPIGLVVGYRGR